MYKEILPQPSEKVKESKQYLDGNNEVTTVLQETVSVQSNNTSLQTPIVKSSSHFPFKIHGCRIYHMNYIFHQVGSHHVKFEASEIGLFLIP